MSLNINIETIYSTQDLSAIINDIKTYAGWYSQYRIKKQVSGKESTQAPSIGESAVQILKDLAKKATLDQKSLDGLVHDLEDYLKNSPKISITLAAIPTQKIKLSIVEWCRTNIDPGVLIDFKFNSTLLGGMVVHYDSHIYDWSFRKQILEHLDKFPETLMHV